MSSQPVPAPVIKETQGTGSAAVIVRQRNGSHATRHPLVGIEQRVGDGTRIRRIEMRDIHIGPHVPVSRNLVSEFGITAVLLEPHVGTVAVRPVIRTAHDTRKPSTADTVGHLRLEGIIGAVTRPDMRPPSSSILRVTILTTPPIALEPYSTEAGPRSTSTRSARKDWQASDTG